MNFNTLSTYKVLHENGQAEMINAKNAEQAIKGASIAELTSPVVSLSRIVKDVRTIEEEIREVTFSAVTEGGAGSIATPASGTIHSGDSIALKAIPDRNYVFVRWEMNDSVISTESSLVYEMPELPENETIVVFKAVFALDDVSWTSEVSPEEAGTAGCLSFPSSGTIKANEAIDLIAIENTGYTFDHWERNGQSVGTNKILNAVVTPLAVGEESCVYTAVFTEE